MEHALPSVRENLTRTRDLHDPAPASQRMDGSHLMVPKLVMPHPGANADRHRDAQRQLAADDQYGLTAERSTAKLAGAISQTVAASGITNDPAIAKLMQTIESPSSQRQGAQTRALAVIAYTPKDAEGGQAAAAIRDVILDHPSLSAGMDALDAVMRRGDTKYDAMGSVPHGTSDAAGGAHGSAYERWSRAPGNSWSQKARAMDGMT